METISVLINDLVAPAYNSNVTHWTDHWKMGWPPIVLFATVVHINSKGYFFPKKKTFTKCEHHLSMTEFIVHSTTSNSQIIQLKYIFLKKVQVLLFCIVLGLTTILFFEEQSGVIFPLEVFSIFKCMLTCFSHFIFTCWMLHIKCYFMLLSLPLLFDTLHTPLSLGT